MVICAVMMAGGRGERFWPKSRKKTPKQFLSLTNDGKTMIQLTFNRLLPFIEPENIYVVTNKDYKQLVLEQLPNIPVENILCEPTAKNTAPCIAFAAAVISSKYEESVMIILPSDHIIQYEDKFIYSIKQAVAVAEKGTNLVTIGITPTYPETGYGYINFRKKQESVYEVIRFVEKPGLDLAEEYLMSGEYLWNSGMFVWKTDSIIENIKKVLPDIYEGFKEIRDNAGTDCFEDTVKKCFDNFRSVSIDYGIMEHAENIYTIPGNFGWNDVGSWTAIESINNKDESGNVTSNDVIAVNTNNSIILGGKKLIATVGLDNIVVVDTDDAILICTKKSVQDIRKVVEKLSASNRHDLI